MLVKENKWMLLSAAGSAIMAFYCMLDFHYKKKSKNSKGSEEEEDDDDFEILEEQIFSKNHVYNEDRIYTKDNHLSRKGSDHQSSKRIHKFCLTGGPCAGKTTSLAFINDKLVEMGYNVFMVPEIPTITMKSGGMIIMQGLSLENVMKFQTCLMKIQIKIEDYFYELATMSNKPSVIICDRGVIDPSAYMSDECWQTIMDEQGWNPIMLRDNRYNAVIHLVTAADGAEEFYTTFGNVARYEDCQNAISTDKRTQQSWVGHPHFSIVDNSEKGFQKKIDKVFQGICKFLNENVGGVHKKYLIESNFVPKELDQNLFEVEEIYLKSEENQQIKIRKRGQNNNFSYIYTLRKLIDSQYHDEKKQITASEYMLFNDQRDENMVPVYKLRKCFLWNKENFIIDSILNENKEIVLNILRIENIEKNDEVKIPDFIKVINEVSGQKEYETFYLAQKKK